MTKIKKMTKFIFIIAVFVFPAMVFARPADPSRFPDLEPLQPPPFEIQAKDTPFFNAPEEKQAETAGQQAESQNQISENKEPGQPVIGAAKSRFGFAWVVLAGILLVIIVYGFKRRGSSKKT
jgi:hypothetical protein